MLDIFCPINKTIRGRRAGGLTSEGKDTSFQRDDGGEANHLTGQQSRSGDLAHRGRCSWRAVLYCTSMVTCKTSTCVDTYIRLISAISPATSETRKTSRTITPDYLFTHTHLGIGVTPGHQPVLRSCRKRQPLLAGRDGVGEEVLPHEDVDGGRGDPDLFRHRGFHGAVESRQCCRRRLQPVFQFISVQGINRAYSRNKILFSLSFALTGQTNPTK